MSDWHQHILATHEEKQTLSHGPWLGDEFPGVALPDAGAYGKWILIRCGSLWTIGQVVDDGPFTVDDSDYVFGSARPRAETLKGQPIFTTKNGSEYATVQGKPIPLSNGAGIDLFPRISAQLGINIDENVQVDWKFLEPPFS